MIPAHRLRTCVLAPASALLLTLALAACGGSTASHPTLPSLGVLAQDAADAHARDRIASSIHALLDGRGDDAVEALCSDESAFQSEAAQTARLLVLHRAASLSARAREALATLVDQIPTPRGAFPRVVLASLRETIHQEVLTPFDGAWFDNPSLGRPSHWRIAGPFDEVDDGSALEPEADAWMEGPWALGGGRVDAWDEPVDAGTFSVADGAPGVFFAETFLRVTEPGDWVIAVEGGNPWQLSINGTRVLARARGDVWSSYVRLVTVHLEPGTHRVLLRRENASREGRAWVAMLPLTDASSFAFVDRPAAGHSPQAAPRVVTQPSGLEPLVASWVASEDPLDAVLAAFAMTWARAPDGMLAVLDRGALPDTPAGGLARALLLLNAEGLPANERASAVVVLARELVERWPELVTFRILLAGELLSNGQREQALVELQEAWAQHPEDPAVGSLLADVLHQLGWAEAAAPIEMALASGARPPCHAVARVIARRQERGRADAPDALPRAWLTCAVGFDAWTRARHQAGEPVEAILADVIARAEQSIAPGGLLRQAARLAMELDPSGERALEVGERRRGRPLDGLSRAMNEVDRLDRVEQADDVFQRQLRDAPASVEAEMLRSLLTGSRPLEDLRIDGVDVVHAWVADGRSLPGAAVYVLDYGATRWMPDGSGWDLVHQIVRLQTRDALGAYGEVGVPDDAFLLSVRTIKPDGRTLVPEDIAGKDSISMPSLELGDFIELEFARPVRPGAIRRPASRGSRFYFRVTDAVMARSLARFDIPRTWEDDFVVDLRNFEGEARRREEGDWVVLEYEVIDMPPTPPVRQAPPLAEWVPSVRTAIGVDPVFRARLYDQLVARMTAPDRQVQAFVDEVRAALPASASRRDLAHAIFRRLNAAPDFSGFFSTPGAWFFSTMQGERQTAVMAALRAAGFEPELVAIRTTESDMAPAPVFDESENDLTAIRVRLPEGTLWMEPDYDHYPFDYLRSEAQGQPAVVLSGPEQGALLTTPTWPARTEQGRVVLDVVIAGDGTAQITCRETLPLRSSASWRSFVEMTDDVDEIRLQFERALSQEFGNIRFGSFSFANFDAPDEPLVIDYDFVAPGIARTDERGGIVLDTAFFERQLDVAFGRDAQREVPMMIAIPIREELEVTVRAEGRSLVSVEPVHVDAAWSPSGARFARRIEERDGGLRMTRTIEVPAARVAPEQYPDFRAFVRETARESRIRARFE